MNLSLALQIDGNSEPDTMEQALDVITGTVGALVAQLVRILNNDGDEWDSETIEHVVQAIQDAGLITYDAETMTFAAGGAA